MLLLSTDYVILLLSTGYALLLLSTDYAMLLRSTDYAMLLLSSDYAMLQPMVTVSSISHMNTQLLFSLFVLAHYDIFLERTDHGDTKPVRDLDSYYVASSAANSTEPDLAPSRDGSPSETTCCADQTSLQSHLTTLNVDDFFVMKASNECRSNMVENVYKRRY